MAEHLNKQLWKSIILDHLLSDIAWAVEAKRELASAQLLLAAIDVVAGLERPADQEETTGNDLIQWCDKYMTLKGRLYTLTGLDLWGARCGFLHGYAPMAKIVREGRARMLGYVDDSKEPVMTDHATKGIVLVSLRALRAAFATGVNDTMRRVNRDAEIAARVNPRLEMMFYSEPLPEHLRRV